MDFLNRITDSETRTVSPMPSDRRVPIPTADLMAPERTVPDSVMPMCWGSSYAGKAGGRRRWLLNVARLY